MPTQDCPICGSTVPAGAFCGRCGADLHAGPGDALDDRLPWLRPSVSAVAPRESVAAPMITSSLFPHLDQPTRNPFRLALALMLGGLIAAVLLRQLGALVSLASLGIPLLFVLYLWQTGVLREMPRHMPAIALTLGAGLGVGWVVLTGGLIARSYGIPMAVGFAVERVFSVGLIISVGGALLMVVPAVVIRLLRPPVRESLEGYVIGALGALSFTGAATLSRLAPQYVSGLINDVRPIRLMVEAILYGVVGPLTAAAAGGLIGIVLWFRPGDRAGEHPLRVRLVLLAFVVQLILVYTAVWLIDSTRLPQEPQLLSHLVMTVLALIVLRVGTQLALLHEKPDHHTGQPLLCGRCERVVPDMPFCPACGAAARASSRSSRRHRRASPPRRAADEPDGSVQSTLPT